VIKSFDPPPILNPTMNEDILTLDKGRVILQRPAKFSEESYQDFENWVNLMLRKAKRSIEKPKEK